MARGLPMRLFARTTMALIIAAHFAGELRSIGVTNFWFLFGIGVTLAQYTYAVAIPVLAWLIARAVAWKTPAA